MKYGKLIGRILYCYVLPAMGTALLILAMFHRELGGVAVRPESDTLLKIMALTLCACTYCAAFMYWNSFVREFQTVVKEADYMDKYHEWYEGLQKKYADQIAKLEEEVV